MAKEATEGSEDAAARSPEKTAPPAAPSAKAPPTAVVVEELPRAIVRRVVKDKLSQVAASSRKKGKGKKNGSKEKEAGEGEEMSVHKDAVLAFAESARIFIHYLSATANDICRESKRQTINADDVIKAIEEIEFTEFIDPLKASLDELRRKNASKRSGAKAKAKESGKKRKSGEEEPAGNVDDAADGPEEEDKEEEEEGQDPDENE